jgi:ElaB/YqjD/DUF883 family membrane-anchored ribosome-binding protein
MVNEPFTSGTRPETASGGNTGASAKLRDAASDLGAQAADAGGQVYRQAADAGRYVGRQVEERPWLAVLAVGVLSLLLGAMLGRASVDQPRSLRDYAEDYVPRARRR